MTEERILLFEGGRFRLVYSSDGSIVGLHLEILDPNGIEITIRSTTDAAIPKQIYDLLRECEVKRNG